MTTKEKWAGGTLTKKVGLKVIWLVARQNSEHENRIRVFVKRRE